MKKKTAFICPTCKQHILATIKYPQTKGTAFFPANATDRTDFYIGGFIAGDCPTHSKVKTSVGSIDIELRRIPNELDFYAAGI